MEDDLFQVLTRLFCRFGADPDLLSPETLINWDLGIEGDDAVDLINMIENELRIEVPIDLSKYFAGESLFAKRREALSISDLMIAIGTARQGAP